MEAEPFLNFGQVQSTDIENQRHTTNPALENGVSWRGRNVQNSRDPDVKSRFLVFSPYGTSCMSIAALALTTMIIGEIILLNNTNDEKGKLLKVIGLLAICGSMIFCCAKTTYKHEYIAE